MKFLVWLDSGANIHSCRKQEIDISEDFTEEEWNSLPETEQEDYMRDVAWDQMDWGYRKIED